MRYTESRLSLAGAINRLIELQVLLLLDANFCVHGNLHNVYG